MCENNLKNGMNGSADQEDEQEIMMEVDGQPDNTEPELSEAEVSEPEVSEPVIRIMRDENELNAELDKIREYYMRGTGTDIGTVDTVIVFDSFEPADDDNAPDSTEQGDYMSLSSRVIEEYLESEDFKPIIRLTQEQLLIDWLTSRHLLTKHDLDD